VAEIAFAQFTSDGRVRHASFLGLRQDKKAKDVKPERTAPSPETPAINITHASRVLFPESGQTKGDLADYYTAMAPLMLPFAANRPMSLVRCPQGRAKACFFQKHDSGSFGPEISHVPITEKDGGTEDYLYLTDAAGILACVQMGTIEFHGWGSRAQEVERPDRMIFDLDPDEGLDLPRSAAPRRTSPTISPTSALSALPCFRGQRRACGCAAYAGPRLGHPQGFCQTLCRGHGAGRA
jgi:bifunctional non-homologous end joining protein LigD